MCLTNNVSVSVYLNITAYKILCTSNSHIDVRLEVSHKEKLQKGLPHNATSIYPVQGYRQTPVTI